jgi:SAM-dependent methyltransferase
MAKIINLSNEIMTRAACQARLHLRQYPWLRVQVRRGRRLLAFSRVMAWPGNWWRYRQYLKQRQSFLDLAKAAEVKLPPLRWYPCLFDQQMTTPIPDPYYFYQDAWGAAQVARVKPKLLVDIGSSAKLLSAISPFFPVVAVDIRPISVGLHHLEALCGSLVELPFRDNSLEFVMSLCVVEHIGLGRYGDTLDPLGLEKALTELRRVIRPGGRLVLSVPVGPSCLAFNAHRIFTRQEFLDLLPGFHVEEEIFCDPTYTKTDPTPSKAIGEASFYCVVFYKP